MALDDPLPVLADRCGCGRPVDTDHRYCPACGSALGPLIGGRSTDSSEVEDRVRIERPGLGLRLAGAGAAALVALLAWGLFRQPADEELAEPPDEASADEASTEPDPSDEENEENEEDRDPEGSGEGTDGAKTEASPSTSSEREAPRPALDGATGASSGLDGSDGSPGPLLGEATGLTLAMGSGGPSTRIQLLDLDTGELSALPPIGGYPVGLVGSSLVIVRDSGRPSLIDLAEPDAEPVFLGPAFDGGSQVLRVDDAAVWVLEGGDGSATVAAYDADGREVDRVDLVGGSASFDPFFVSRARPPELIYHPAGGLYRQDGDGYERVVRGQVLAVGERVAIVRDCDQNLACQTLWYDTDTAAVIGFPSLPPTGEDALFRIIGGDRWLFYIDWETGSPRLIDIGRGRVVRELDRSVVFGPVGPTAVVSADGRWLVDRSEDGGLVVVDLNDGTEWPIDVPGLEASPAVTIIEIP